MPEISKIPRSFIIGIVGLLVIISTVGVAYQLTDTYTRIYTETNESLGTITVPQVVQTANYPVVENSETIRLTNTTQTEQLNRGVDYTVISYEEGKFNITSAKGLRGTITGYIDYQYHSPDYITDPGVRSMISLIVLLLAVGIILFAVKIFY